MRPLSEVESELARVRAEREQYYHTQVEPLSDDAPDPMSLDTHQYGGAAELLERESQLILEADEIRRVTGMPIRQRDEDRVDEALRIMRRIDRAVEGYLPRQLGPGER